MSPDPERVPTRVWDLPLRLFHWSLVLGVVALVITAKVGGNAMVWHVRLGLIALALLVFRLAWGFVGSHWSRFANFALSPASLREYLHGSAGPQGLFEIGHSPPGALAVTAMLCVLAVQVATGLVADDEVATVGPLNRFVSGAFADRASAWHHHWGQWLIYLLVASHIAAVLYYLRVRRTNLIRPMIDGDKALPAGAPASADGSPQRLLALALALGAGALAWWIGRLGVTP
jgi:cytochrome b